MGKGERDFTLPESNKTYTAELSITVKVPYWADEKYAKHEINILLRHLNGLLKDTTFGLIFKKDEQANR